MTDERKYPDFAIPQFLKKDPTVTKTADSTGIVAEVLNAPGHPGAARAFHIGDILSITGDKLVSPRLVEGVYDILNFMTGDSLYTHQLPRAMRECRPHLLKQHPELASVDESNVTAETWRAWLDEQIKRFGETLPVTPVPADSHEFIDPVSELAEMVHPSRIITINAGKP
jgi:hypothetical protein